MSIATPVHVTIRVRPEIRSLRNHKMHAVIRRALLHANAINGFAIVHYSIQGNHLHLLVEARSNALLARGMRSFGLRFAKQVNRRLGRRGSVYADRYHLEVISSPRQARRALAYVLLNSRRHGLRVERSRSIFDPFSSAWDFDGWSLPEALGERPFPRCTPRPRSWLLRAGWRRHGLIDPYEVPGPRDLQPSRSPPPAPR